jgi:hypothetical protein
VWPERSGKLKKKSFASSGLEQHDALTITLPHVTSRCVLYQKYFEREKQLKGATELVSVRIANI